MKFFYNNPKKQGSDQPDLPSGQVNTLPTLSLKPKRTKKQKIMIWTGVSFGIIVFLVIILGIPGYSLYKQGKQVYGTASQLKNSLKEQDYEKSQDELKTLKSELIRLDKTYGYLGYLKIVPFVSKYYKDGEAVLEAGNHGVIAGDLLLSGIEPFKDIFGFKVAGDESDEKTADEKMAELVKIMPQLLPSLDAAITELDEMEKSIDKIDPKDYPEKFGEYNVRDSLSEVKGTFGQAKELAHNIRPLLEKLPEAMGEPEPVQYVILFQNDKELRPTGGFITAYAIVTMDEGRFKIVKSEDIYNIDHDQSYAETPEFIRQYLVPNLYMRDSNISPDFKVSMDTFSTYWKNITGIEVQGIIAIDTEFVRSFMEVTGPIYVAQYNETFEAENIVYELELYSEKILTGTTRKDFLGEIMGEMVDKVFSAKNDKWRPLLEKGLTEISQKHMLFYFYDDTLQNFSEEYNFAGRIKDFDGDYLHVNDANLGGLKSDYWIEREVSQKITIAEDGTVSKEVSVTFNNRGQFDGWLNATTRTYTRIYVPKGSKLISSEGGDYGSNAQLFEDLDKTVFANFTRTKPQTSETIKFTYELPFKVTKAGLFGRSSYKLMVQKQPGIGQPQPALNRPKYTIELNGEVKENYELLTDSEFEWEL